MTKQGVQGEKVERADTKQKDRESDWHMSCCKALTHKRDVKFHANRETEVHCCTGFTAVLIVKLVLK